MAKVGSLVVDLVLQSAQFISQINKASQATARATASMQASMSSLQRQAALTGRAITGFFTISGAINAARAVSDYADAWKLATNQVAAANAISTHQARSMEGINEIASRTRTSISETAELYAKLLRSTSDVANSEEEVARATELVNKAFKAGGASLSEQVNGIRQLAQSLASGIFQGDELRSIRENAPLLAQAIAEEFNTTIGGLKRLGAEGQLTADRVFKAILRNSKPIEDAFNATNATIAESFTILNNSITQYVGQTDKALGISKGFSQGMKLLADNFKAMADQVLTSNGEIGRFIALYKEVQKLQGTGAVKSLSVQYTELGEVVGALYGLFTSNKNVIGDAFSRVAHPVNAFLHQLNLGAEAAIYLGKQLRLIEEIKPPTKNWSEFVKTIQGGPFLFKMPEFDAEQFREAFKPNTKELEEFRQEVMRNFVQLGDLAEAARQGQDAFDSMQDKIAATNDVIKAGILPTSELGKAFIEVVMATREVERAFEGIINAIEGAEAAQRQVGQQKLLALALSISSEEYRKLKDHIDLLNEAESQNIDITTQQGQAWLTAKAAAQQYDEELEKLKDRQQEIADTINATVSSAISSVSSAFADAIVEGENFRDMLDGLLKDLAKLAINQVFQLFLKQMIGQVGGPGGTGTGLLGVTGLHSGGIVGNRVGGRSVPAAMFAGAPRLHGGGGAFFGGAEFPAILQRGEGVFTPEQMKALGGGTTNNFTVINQAPNTTTTEDRQSNASGGTDITVFIRQAMTKEISDPASSVHKSLKSNFGLSQAGVRR